MKTTYREEDRSIADCLPLFHRGGHAHPTAQPAYSAPALRDSFINEPVALRGVRDPEGERPEGSKDLMSGADLGTGALLVLMDAIRQKVREKKKEEEKKRLEVDAYDDKGTVEIE